MDNNELILKIISMIEQVENKIDDNNTQLIEKIELRIDTLETKIGNCVTKEECKIKSKENIGIRKITSIGIMIGAIGTATMGILSKIKELVESFFK
jgi:hypothetical protein